MVEQRMGDGVGILPGNAEKQQQLQHLNVREALQPFLQEALLQPLAVSVVNRHIFHLVVLTPCYFVPFPLE